MPTRSVGDAVEVMAQDRLDVAIRDRPVRERARTRPLDPIIGVARAQPDHAVRRAEALLGMGAMLQDQQSITTEGPIRIASRMMRSMVQSL